MAFITIIIYFGRSFYIFKIIVTYSIFFQNVLLLGILSDSYNLKIADNLSLIIGQEKYLHIFIQNSLLSTELTTKSKYTFTYT